MKPQVIYVAGYGRSGSTLLDVLIGNCPGYWGIGEATNVFAAALAGESCSCGLMLIRCPEWGPILTNCESLESLQVQQRRSEGMLGLFGCTLGRKYRQFWIRFLAECARRGVAIVDSSKSGRTAVFRALNLQRLGASVMIVHLFRDPQAVLASLARGSNKDLSGGKVHGRFDHLFVLRSFLGAIFANTAALLVGRCMVRNYIFVRYEDLIDNPRAVLEKLGVNSRDGINFDRLGPGHAVAGNRMRKATPYIAAGVRITSMERSGVRSPRFYRVLFNLLEVFARARDT